MDKTLSNALFTYRYEIRNRGTDRDATAREILLDSKRIEETLRPTGLLFLVKKLFERSQVGHFQFARVGIVLETNRISVHYETRRYEAERQLCSSTFGVKVLAS
jgi:hypothetical protein